MKKIPSLFERDENDPHGIVVDKVTPGCEWVLNGEGWATAKLDGTSCAVIDGKFYKRFDNSRRKGEERIQKTQPLSDWVHCGDTSERGKWIYWIPVTSKDYYHQIAWAWGQGNFEDGTYELIGPEVQGNPHNCDYNELLKHGSTPILGDPRTYEEISCYLELSVFEGIVWHHEDGRMCKITKTKFGLPWNDKGNNEDN